MKHKHSHLLLGYWSRLRKGRFAPDRRDIDPGEIKRVLPAVFLLAQAKAGAAYQFRLAGTGLCHVFGQELRDRNFLDGWSPDCRAMVRGALEHVLRRGEPVCMTAHLEYAGRPSVAFEYLLLPLLDELGEPSRVLGCAYAIDGAAPREGGQIMRQRLSAVEVVAEVAVQPLPPAHINFRPTRSPFLRVVETQE